MNTSVLWNTHIHTQTIYTQTHGKHIFILNQEGQVTLLSPRFSSEEKIDKRSIRVKVYRRLYHMLQGPKPDLVIGEDTHDIKRKGEANAQSCMLVCVCVGVCMVLLCVW